MRAELSEGDRKARGKVFFSVCLWFNLYQFLKAVVDIISCPTFHLGLPAYYILALSEASRWNFETINIYVSTCDWCDCMVVTLLDTALFGLGQRWVHKMFIFVLSIEHKTNAVITWPRLWSWSEEKNTYGENPTSTFVRWSSRFQLIHRVPTLYQPDTVMHTTSEPRRWKMFFHNCLMNFLSVFHRCKKLWDMILLQS